MQHLQKLLASLALVASRLCDTWSKVSRPGHSVDVLSSGHVGVTFRKTNNHRGKITSPAERRCCHGIFGTISGVTQINELIRRAETCSTCFLKSPELVACMDGVVLMASIGIEMKLCRLFDDSLLLLVGLHSSKPLQLMINCCLQKTQAASEINHQYGKDIEGRPDGVHSSHIVQPGEDKISKDLEQADISLRHREESRQPEIMQGSEQHQPQSMSCHTSQSLKVSPVQITTHPRVSFLPHLSKKECNRTGDSGPDRDGKQSTALSRQEGDDTKVKSPMKYRPYELRVHVLETGPRQVVTSSFMRESLNLYVRDSVHERSLEHSVRGFVYEDEKPGHGKLDGEEEGDSEAEMNAVTQNTDSSVLLKELTASPGFRLASHAVHRVCMYEVDERQQYQQEKRRLASYVSLTAPHGVWFIKLAAAGFYLHDRARCILRCAYCDARLDMTDARARRPMEPAVHRVSPPCPIVTGQAGNVSLEQVGHVTGRSFIRSMFGPSGEDVKHLRSSGPVETGLAKHAATYPSQGGRSEADQVPPTASAVISSQRSTGPGSPSGMSDSPQSHSTAHVSRSQQSEDQGNQNTGASAPAPPALHGTVQSSIPPTRLVSPTPQQSVGTGTQTRATPAGQPTEPVRPLGPVPAGPVRQGHLTAPTQPSGGQARESTSPRPSGPVSSQAAQAALPFQTARPVSPHRAPAPAPTPAPAPAPATRAAATGSASDDGPSAGSATITPPPAPQSPPNSSEPQPVTYAQLGIYIQEPKRPDFVILSARINTYTGWPHSSTHSPEEMARAGFYYVGQNDLVRCFHCKGGLKSWAEPLRPWVEHARFFPHCQFVGQVKGQEFVDVVQELKGRQETITVSEVEDILMRRQRDIERGNGDQDQEETDEVLEDAASASGSNGQWEDEEGGDTLLRTAAEELETENQELKNTRLCKICQMDEVSILFVPCGHLCACAQCASALRTCAICRQRVKGRIRVNEAKVTLERSLTTYSSHDHGSNYQHSNRP